MIKPSPVCTALISSLWSISITVPPTTQAQVLTEVRQDLRTALYLQQTISVLDEIPQ
jgi:hypothetical protein